VNNMAQTDGIVRLNGNDLDEALKDAFGVKSFEVKRIVKEGYNGEVRQELEFNLGDRIFIEGRVWIATESDREKGCE